VSTPGSALDRAHEVAMARANEHHCPGCALNAEWPGADLYAREVVMAALVNAPRNIRRAASHTGVGRLMATLFTTGILVGLELARLEAAGEINDGDPAA
jgi:hypothetical protein